MSMRQWENFFKLETRNSGLALVKKDKVSLAYTGDTEVQAFVKSTSVVKIIFKLESIVSTTINVHCNCTQSSKGQFCKHIWATLLVINQKKPDFLDSKYSLEKTTQIVGVKTEIQQLKKENYKLKQADYRKEQYQKQKEYQKQKAKDFKKSKNQNLEDNSYPPAIELALKYFLENGFALRESPNEESINTAKKKLSRVFHPDLGGSHNEILELNKQAEVLLKFFKG